MAWAVGSAGKYRSSAAAMVGNRQQNLVDGPFETMQDVHQAIEDRVKAKFSLRKRDKESRGVAAETKAS